VREVVPLVEPIDLAMYVIKSKTQTTLDKWGSKRQLSQELKDALRNLRNIKDANRYDADGDPHGAYHDLDSHFYRKETKESRDFWKKWDEIPEHVKYHNLEEGHPLRPSKTDVGMEELERKRARTDTLRDWSDYTFTWEYPQLAGGASNPKFGEPVSEKDLPEYFESEEYDPDWGEPKDATRKWMNDYHRKHGRYEHISGELPGKEEYFGKPVDPRWGRNPRLTVQEMVEGPAKGGTYQSTLPMHDWSLDKFSGWKGVDPVVAYRENPRWSNLMAAKRGLEARPMTAESITWDEAHHIELRHSYRNWVKEKKHDIKRIEDDIKWYENKLQNKDARIGSEMRDENHYRTQIDALNADLDKHKAELYDENDEVRPMEENAAYHEWNVNTRTHGSHGGYDEWEDDEGLAHHYQPNSVRRQKFHHQGRRGNFVYPPNTRNWDGKFIRDNLTGGSREGLARLREMSRNALDIQSSSTSPKVEPWQLRSTDIIGIRGDPFKMRGQFANLGLGQERAEAFLEEDIPREQLVFGGLPRWMTEKKELKPKLPPLSQGRTTDTNQWPHMGFDMVDALNAQGVSSGAPIVGWEQDGANFHFKDVMGNIVHSMTADEARKYAGDERGWVNEAV